MPQSIRKPQNRSADLSEVTAHNDLAPVDELEPDQRRAAVQNRYSPTLLLVALAATIGVVAYAAFLLNPQIRGDLIPWSIVIGAEAILVFHAIMSLWTMLSGYGRQPTYSVSQAQAQLYSPRTNERLGVSIEPSEWPLFIDGSPVEVDVLITVYGEPLETIRRTAEAALAIKGRHYTYLLDDGDSDAVRDLAAELGCHYVRRLGSSGAKAGNINNALTVAKSPYFVILDADFVAKPEFLEETMPFMVDSNVAFVQTPQVYGNLRTIISRGAGYMQTMFYRFVQPGRNEFNAAFCVGTNVLFRRAAIDDLGGMYTQSNSEDVWTSLLLHERGWRSVFLPMELAIGETPDTIESYSKQQLRWATGGFEILFTHNPFSRRRRLTLDQRLMYFVTATHYLTGIAPGLLMFVPALEIFFDLRPVTMNVEWWQWALFYSGFYVLQIVLAAVIAGTFRWEVLLLSVNSFPIYIKAFFNALLRVETRWSVTGANRGGVSAFNFIRVQVYCFAFLLLTTLVSLWRDSLMSTLTIATIWCAVNTVSLGAFIFVAVQEDHRRRLAAAGKIAPRLEHHESDADAPLGEETLDAATIAEAREARVELVESLNVAVPARSAGPATLTKDRYHELVCPPEASARHQRRPGRRDRPHPPVQSTPESGGQRRGRRRGADLRHRVVLRRRRGGATGRPG